MAAMKKQYREPAPASYPFATGVGSKVYSWVGLRDPKQKQLKVDVFDPIRESWKQLDSRGDCPVHQGGSTVVAVGNDMYIFAGTDSDGLHKLDTATMKWTYINPRGVVRPTPRGGGKMVAIEGNRLALFAGYTPKREVKNKNPFQKNKTIGGICDEFHIFHIERGMNTLLAVLMLLHAMATTHLPVLELLASHQIWGFSRWWVGYYWGEGFIVEMVR